MLPRKSTNVPPRRPNAPAAGGIQRRSFTLNGSKPKFDRDNTPAAYGLHLCKVVNLREHHGHNGFGVWLDLVVLAFASVSDDLDALNTKLQLQSPAGFQFSFSVYPDNATANGRMTREMAYAREQGKIQLMIASAAGLTPNQAERVDDNMMEALCACPQKDERGQRVFPDRDEISKLEGCLVVVERHHHVTKSGKNAGNDSGYYEPHAYVARLFPEFADAVKTAKYKPYPNLDNFFEKVEEETAGEGTFEERAEAAGWINHSDDKDYWYREDSNADPILAEELEKILSAA